MKYFRTLIAASACAACAPTLVRAQHADVSPRVSNGRIVTDAFDDAAGAVTPGGRVFAYDFGEDPLDPYFAADPGFNAFAGSGLPAGGQLRFDVVGAASLGLPANLSYWNGAGTEVSLTAAPAGEALRLNLGAQNVTVGSGTTGLAGFAIGTAAADGSLHRHLNSFLLGPDGNAEAGDGVVPAAGVYVVPIELTSSDAAVADSAPLFLVFNNGLSEAAHDRAVEYVEASLVPEPAALGLIGWGASALLSGRRRRRRPST